MKVKERCVEMKVTTRTSPIDKRGDDFGFECNPTIEKIPLRLVEPTGLLIITA